MNSSELHSPCSPTQKHPHSNALWNKHIHRGSKGTSRFPLHVWVLMETTLFGSYGNDFNLGLNICEQLRCQFFSQLSERRKLCFLNVILKWIISHWLINFQYKLKGKTGIFLPRAEVNWGVEVPSYSQPSPSHWECSKRALIIKGIVESSIRLLWKQL